MLLSSRRDNSPEFIYKALWFHRALFFAYRRIISLELRLTKVRPLSFGLKTTLSCFYSFAAVLTVLQEIISTFGRIQKNAPIFRGIFYYLLENVEINPLWDFRYVADATRYSYRSICSLCERGIYLISSLSEAKTYRICRKANI